MTERDEPKASVQRRADEDVQFVGESVGAMVGAALAGPFGVFVGAASGSLVELAVRRGIDYLQEVRRRRVESVVAEAAGLAGIRPDELVARLQDDDRLHALFVATLIAAQGAGEAERLLALAQALARGIDENESLEFEILFVRAIGDLEPPHVMVLRSFLKSSYENNLATRTDDHGPQDVAAFSEPVRNMNQTQLDLVHPGLKAVLPPVMATLARHGLVQMVTTGEGSWGPRPADYAITPFGEAVVARLADIATVLAERE